MSPASGPGDVGTGVHPVIAFCVGFLVLGVVVAVRWGGQRFEGPPTKSESTSTGERALRALWYTDVHLVAALATGLLVVGPGGRLVMRLLAVTAGEAAQGRITEADQTVGRITVDGTLGFIVFGGLFGGFLLGLVAAVLRPWLPPGRVGALCVAGVLLLTAATRNDPLRPENPDFDLVGPGWLAIVAFAALVVLSALTFEAMAARLAKSVPLANLRRPVTLLPYLPLVLMALTATLPLALAAVAVAALLGGLPVLRRWWTGPVRTIGRVALAVAVVALVPALVSDLSAIAT